MPLQLIVDSLDSIPEPLRAQYKEEDGKYRLDLEGYEDPSRLKSALEKERGNARDAVKMAKAWKDLGKTPEEIQALLEAHAQAERDKLVKGGEWEKLKQQMLDQHKTELGKKDEVVGKMRGNLERYLVDAQAVAAISELKGVPALLLPHVKASVKVVEDGEQFVTRVVDSDGNPRVNGKGEYLSIKDLVSEMRSSDVYGRAFEPSGTSGGGAQQSQGGNAGAGKKLNIAGSEAERAAYFAQKFNLNGAT